MLNLQKKMLLVEKLIAQSYTTKKVINIQDEDNWHHDLLHETAEILELYDPQTGQVPIWLSRVVTGVMQDVDDSE